METIEIIVSYRASSRSSFCLAFSKTGCTIANHLSNLKTVKSL